MLGCRGGEGESEAGASHEKAPKAPSISLTDGASKLSASALGLLRSSSSREKTPPEALCTGCRPSCSAIYGMRHDRANTANIGYSGKAPRTASESVTDLHRLLEKADVPCP
jgi:hypothetical protein